MKHITCKNCKRYAGMYSKSYFICNWNEEQQYFIDKEYINYGKCENYVDIHDNAAMERRIEKDDQSIPNKE